MTLFSGEDTTFARETHGLRLTGRGCVREMLYCRYFFPTRADPLFVYVGG